MIWRPKRGQRVEIRYQRGPMRLAMKLHGCRGTVRRAGRGPGPINAEVLLDPPEAGIRVIVPRGNLVAADEWCERHGRSTPCPQCAISEGMRFWWAEQKRKPKP